ncbi:MAG: type II secretion system protein [Terracidiphilus sp.]
MTKPAPIRRARPSRSSKSEEGYILVAVIFLLALFTIALAVALPKVIKEIQRDRELETMHRGKQYIRGIRMYYKKFGAYPPNVDALVKPTNNIRFMRKKYADPTTGKEDWKPVLFGQNKAPTAMGFFGQPMGGSTVAGTGPSGANTGLTGSSGLSGSSSVTPPTPPTDPNAPPALGTDTSNPAGGSTTQSGTTTGPTAGSTTGQTFGGAGIIGFSPNSPKESIMVYKKKNHYNEWEFVYDPIAEQMMQGGNIANKAGLSGTGTSSGSGSGSGSGLGTGIMTGGNNSSGNPIPSPSTPQ